MYWVEIKSRFVLSTSSYVDQSCSLIAKGGGSKGGKEERGLKVGMERRGLKVGMEGIGLKARREVCQSKSKLLQKRWDLYYVTHE